MPKLFERLRIALNSSSWDAMIQAWKRGEDIGVGSSGDLNVAGNTSLHFSAVFACCRVLAETYASVPIMEYRKLADGDREKTDATGLYDVLHHQFNDEMSAYNAKEMAMYQVNLGGNVVFERIQNRFGDVIGLYPYEWERVKIDRNPETKKLIYRISSNCTLKGETYVEKRRDQVLHIPGPSLNGVVGMSPIEYAAQAVRLGLSYEKFGVNFYKNGAIPSGTFEHPGALGDEAYKRLAESLRKEWAGLHNAGTPMLLEDGLKYNQLTMKLADAQLLESKKFQIEDICRIYRVPLHLVQNLDRATNNNIEHQSLEFVMYTMLPIFKRFEEAINTQLLTREQRSQGYYFEHNMAALLRGDQKSMAEAFALGRNGGWLSVNDIRRMLNMNKIPNGDIYLQPMNMIEAGTVVEPPQDTDGYKKELENIYKLMEESKK